MTKEEIRRARKQLGAINIELTERGQPQAVREHTPRQEVRHAKRMDKWARMYDQLNGAPEGWWD